MGKSTIQDLRKEMEKVQDKKRYEHTLGVAYTAACLAMCNNIDVEKAKIAGLLHDCAKCYSNDKRLKLCQKYKIDVTDIELRNPFLLHAKVGAYVAKNKYEINDSDILNAITYHTTGRPEMSMLEKIIFIADYIEPGRSHSNRLPYLRKLAFGDIDKTLYEILKDTLAYLNSTGDEIDPATQITYDYYKNYRKE